MMVLRSILTLDVLAAVAAGTAPAEWMPPIAASAIIATVLGWFMFRVEKRLEGIKLSLDEARIAKEYLARSNFLLIMSLKQGRVDDSVREDAREQVAQMDRRRKSDT
jgi:hypothetical protein